MQENNSDEEDETQLQYISDDEHRTVLDYEDEDSDAENTEMPRIYLLGPVLIIKLSL
jgi:hypothetical protein